MRRVGIFALLVFALSAASACGEESSGAAGSPGGGAGTTGSGGSKDSSTAGGAGGNANAGGVGGSANSGGVGGSANVGGVGGGAGSADAGLDGSAASGGAADGASCPPPPTALPWGPLTRWSGNPLLRNGPELYDFAKTGPRVVIRIGPGDYRMWYEAVSQGWMTGTGVTAIGYAKSSDGLTWTKQGIVLSPAAAWEKSEVSPNSLLVENGVFRLYYHGGGYPSATGARLGNASIGYATSSDGIAWTAQAQPVLTPGASGSFDDDQVAEPRVLAVNGGYRMYFTGRNAATGQTSLGMATSPDGITWSKASPSPILDTATWGNFWGGAFFFESGIWHLWHGVSAGSSSSLHYKWSTDGISWTDGPNNPVLAQSSDSGAADYGLVGDSVSGYRDGAVYRILYTGFNINLFGSEGRFEGICQASIDAVCP